MRMNTPRGLKQEECQQTAKVPNCQKPRNLQRCFLSFGGALSVAPSADFTARWAIAADGSVSCDCCHRVRYDTVVCFLFLSQSGLIPPVD